MKISQREMILGVATLGCLLIGGTWYGAAGKYAEWKNMKTEMTTLKRDIERHTTAIQMQDTWNKDLAALQSELRVFPLDQQSVAPQLMKTINAIADKHGFQIDSSNPYDEEKIGDLYELGINCGWRGTLSALVGFLTELQQQGLRYDVNSLNISPAGGSEGNLKGNMVINCAYTRQADSG